MFKKITPTAYQHPAANTPQVSRRAFLLSSAVMAALASMNLSSLIKPALAEGHSQADFARLSAFLTGQTTLDAISAQRFFAALVKHDPSFGKKAATLLHFIDAGKFPHMDAFLAASQTSSERATGAPTKVLTEVPSEAPTKLPIETAAGPTAAAATEVAIAAAKTTPEMMSTVTSIVSAWYLGIVGAAADAELITYESSLMYVPTKGILAVPTYGPGPLAWGETPAGAVGTSTSTNTDTNTGIGADTAPAHTPA